MPGPPFAFKVDENLPEEVAAALRDVGHEAATVGDQGLVGVEDARLAEVLQRERRVLITLHTDFADVRTYRRVSTQVLSCCEWGSRTKHTC